MKPLLLGLLLVSPLFAMAALACGEEPEPAPSPASPPPADGGAVDSPVATDEEEEKHDGHESEDSGPPPIRCSDEELAALDLTDGGTLEITFELLANPKQYVNNCATVKAGSTVVFRGGFRQHPLEPAGGDVPNPIPTVEEDQPGNELVITMPAPGTFGYQCIFHPRQMYGAIRVVP